MTKNSDVAGDFVPDTREKKQEVRIKHLENLNADLEERNSKLLTRTIELEEALKKQSFKPASEIESSPTPPIFQADYTFENLTVMQFRMKLGELIADKPTDTKFTFIVVEQNKK